MKVVVLVSGGVVQAAYGPRGTEVDVVDFDDDRSEGLNDDQCESHLKAAMHGLEEIYP